MRKIEVILIMILVLFQACEEPNMEAFDNANEYNRHLDSAQQAEKALSIGNPDVESNGRVEVNEPPFSSSPLRLFNRRDQTQNTIDSEYTSNLSSWNPSGALAGASTKDGTRATGVEAAVSNGTMFTFYTGAGSTDFSIYTTFSSDGSNWTSHVLPSSFKTTKKMGAVHYDDDLYLFHTAATNENNLYWGKYNGGSSWTHLGQVPNVNVYGNYAWLATVGSSGDNGRIAVDAIEFDDRLLVFYGDNGEIRCSYSATSGSTSWPSWTDVNVATSAVDEFAGIESVVYNGQVYVFFWKVSNNRIYFMRSSDPTNPNSWSSFGPLWDKRTERPLSATVYGNSLVLAYKGYYNDDNIWWAKLDGGWTDLGHTGYRTHESPEVILYNSTPNLALNASASATSTYPGYSAGKVNDGNTNTTVGGSYSWANDHPSGGWLPEDVTLNFGSSKSFNSVVLYTSSGYELQDYDIQKYNGSSWVTISSITGNTSTIRTHIFSTQTSQYLRFRCIKGPNIQTIYGRINEIEVY